GSVLINVFLCLQPFSRFVETGRIALVADGEYKNKLVAIVDVIDQTRVLVDGPATGVPRCAIRLKQIHLTKLTIKFPFNASTKIVQKAWEDAKVTEKFGTTGWANNLQKDVLRNSMTDFDRFRLGVARSARNKLRTRAYCILRKTAHRQGYLTGKSKTSSNKPKPLKKNVLAKRQAKTGKKVAKK
ncbi:PREDICTED: 60S ribosomal protein L14, partial [Nicrophorus vespilloides]|uniref:Large ribosomal subunit protein eL14 n=1 Tax=Nicrophorus vespilloides TaxID=110193 RepID=A0ABM1ME13_NICVS